MLYLKSLWLLLCLVPLPISAEVKASALIEEILDRAVKPIQMDFITQGDQLFALTYAQRHFTALRRETDEVFNIEGYRPIAMYDLLHTETESRPGTFALALVASPSRSVVKSVFETFGEAADRCLKGVSCTVHNLSFRESMWAYDDIFRIITDAISDDTSVYESLTFLSISNLDGSKFARHIFFIQSADVVVGLVEPRDRVGRSFGNANNIVYDVLIFEKLR